jgi:hypothetical protein
MKAGTSSHDTSRPNGLAAGLIAGPRPPDQEGLEG